MVVILFLLLFVLLILWCFVENNYFNKINESNFLSKESTGALRGVAIIAIVFSHIFQNAPEIKELLWGGKYLYTLVFMWGGIGVAIFFILSGYGCYISLGKAKNKLIWLVRHIAKLLVYFIITFTFVLFINSIILGKATDFKELWLSFITLRLPYTTSWYFRIQLLFYILLVISEILKERQVVLILIFVLGYACIAKYSGLADYWWKTSLCFAIGCVMAKYKDKLVIFMKSIRFKLILIVVGCGAVVYTRIDFHYILFFQLIAYVCIAGCIVIVWDWIFGKNKLFENIGKASLAMYLVHIGIVDTVYSLNTNINIKSLIFVIVTAIGTGVCYFVSESINKKLLFRG